MPDLTFNTSTRRYERDGRAVDAREVRDAVRAVADASKERVRQAAEDYRAGKINRPELIITIRTEMVSAQTAAAVIARGGRSQMTAAEWGRSGARVRTQNEFLRAKERGLANGTIPADGRLVTDAMSYVDSAVTAYENEVLEREREAGAAKVVWVCEADGASCEECLTTAGEYGIDDVPAIGSLSCLNRCRCFISYEEAA